MDSTKTIVSIAARTDALFWPCRDREHPGVRYVLRQQFHERGIPWRSEGRDEAEQKRTERALDMLVAEGKVLASRRQARTQAVKLPPEVYLWARVLCWQAPYAEALEHYDRLVTLVAAGQCVTHIGRRLVPETLLAGREWGENPYDENGLNLYGAVQMEILPLITFGCVEAIPNSGRGIYYRPREQPLQIDVTLPAANDSAERFYLRHFKAELD